MLLSGISWTFMYLPSHWASSGHRIWCSGVWNADHWLWWRWGCWHSKCWHCVQDIAAEARELTQWWRDGLEPLRQHRCQQQWLVAVTMDRSTMCHHVAPCVRILRSHYSIPCTAGCHLFNKCCWRDGHIYTWSAISRECPSCRCALIWQLMWPHCSRVESAEEIAEQHSMVFISYK